MSPFNIKKIFTIISIIFTISFFLPFFSLAESTLTTTELKPTSVVLKATTLVPNTPVKFQINNIPPTPTYFISHNFMNSDEQGVASDSFSGLTAGKEYLATVYFNYADKTKNKPIQINFFTPNPSTVTLTTISLEATSVTLKAEKLVPNSKATFKVTDLGQTTTRYFKSQETTSDNSGSASSSFSELSSEGTFKATIIDSNSKETNITFTTPKASNSISVSPVKTKLECKPPQKPNADGTACVTNTDTTYEVLAPIPGTGLEGTIDTKYNKDTNPCPFGNYLNIMIKIIIGFAAVLAMVMIVSGGIQYMTSELVSSKEAGKEQIQHAIFGLIIALGSFLILNTINPKLLDACLNQLPIAEIVVDDSVPQTPINGKYCTNTQGTNGGYLANADWTTIAGAIKTLPAGFVSNHPGKDCTKVGEQNCTSLRGLNMSILEKIKVKCTNCGTITVTAGTECWLHGGAKQSTTHHPNSSTIDLSIRSNEKLNTYIRTGTKENSWYQKDGVYYLSEGDHWHVGSAKK